MTQGAQRHALLNAFSSLPSTDGAVIVAFSGGLDSTALLHALVTAGHRRLIAVHVHHGLQAAADDWAAHCVQFCASLEVACRVRHAQIDPADPAGPEAAARIARYGLLRAELPAGGVLITAHHRDDQAETVLLQLLRGSGVHGLAAMRPWTSFAPGHLWRPFLDVDRATLHDYAQAHALSWLEDPHNQDARYARSWLRSAWLPSLRERWPQADLSLSRAAARAAEAAELLDELADGDLDSVRDGDTLQIPALVVLSAPRRRNLLRRWLVTAGFAPPSAAMLARIERELLDARVDATPLLAWPGLELRRYRERLYAMVPLAVPSQPGIWRGVAGMNWCEGILMASEPPPRSLRVRTIQAGESLRPAGAAHRRSVKNLFQERGVPPWLRVRLPVIELEGHLACIAGVAATDEWRAFTAGHGWKPTWRHHYCGLESPLSL